MLSFFKQFNQVQTVIALRSFAIVVQILLILFVIFALDYSLPWLSLTLVILLEFVFNIASFMSYKEGKEASKNALFMQICADILFLSLLLYFSGGATNAFVSLLLVPIAIAAVTLTAVRLLSVAFIAIACYSFLLWLLPMHVMHGNMEGHFIAMWINFLFSSAVVAMVVGKMSRSINQKELAIAKYQEKQLKQEQVIALGVASAQVTHQLATPIATIQLLTDELLEEQADNIVYQELQGELKRCSESLAEFRQRVFDIKEHKLFSASIAEVLHQMQDHLLLNYPEMSINTKVCHSSSTNKILTDASLLPAIVNLLSNAIRATKANNCNQINVSSQIVAHNWQLTIRDFGQGFKIEKLAELGLKPVDSEQGFGMAVLLSHASLERLGGKLSLTNHEEQGAVVTLYMPLSRE